MRTSDQPDSTLTRGLLLDEMLSPKIAVQLRRRRHDVYAVAERADLVGRSDEEILSLGAEEDRVVVTMNVADFVMLHADWQSSGRSHGGLLYVSALRFPQDRAFVGALVRSLDKTVRVGLPSADESSFLQRT